MRRRPEHVVESLVVWCVSTVVVRENSSAQQPNKALRAVRRQFERLEAVRDN